MAEQRSLVTTRRIVDHYPMEEAFTKETGKKTKHPRRVYPTGGKY